MAVTSSAGCSHAAARNATHAPKENPPNHSGSPGQRCRAQARAGRQHDGVVPHVLAAPAYRQAGLGQGADPHMPPVARRRRSGEGVELQHPLAVGVRGGGLRLAREGDGHRLAGVGPTPDRHRLLALENHMVRDRKSVV